MIIREKYHFMVKFKYKCYTVAVEDHIPGYLYGCGDYQIFAKYS